MNYYLDFGRSRTLYTVMIASFSGTPLSSLVSLSTLSYTNADGAQPSGYLEGKPASSYIAPPPCLLIARLASIRIQCFYEAVPCR